MRTRPIIPFVFLGLGSVVVTSQICRSGVALPAYRGYRNVEAAVSPRIDDVFRAIDA